jgi:hypothetical protein
MVWGEIHNGSFLGKPEREKLSDLGVDGKGVFQRVLKKYARDTEGNIMI